MSTPLQEAPKPQYGFSQHVYGKQELIQGETLHGVIGQI